MCPGRDEEEEAEERECVCVWSVCVEGGLAEGPNTIKPSGTSALQSANPPSITPLLPSTSLSILPHPLSKSTGDLGSF